MDGRAVLVSKDYSGNRPVSTLPSESTGTIVHLKGYGFRVFKVDKSITEISSPDKALVPWAKK